MKHELLRQLDRELGWVRDECSREGRDDLAARIELMRLRVLRKHDTHSGEPLSRWDAYEIIMIVITLIGLWK